MLLIYIIARLYWSVIKKAHLTSEDGKTIIAPEISYLESTQEETDTRIILNIDYAQNNEYRYARVKSPDSDIFLFCYTMQTSSNIS